MPHMVRCGRRASVMSHNNSQIVIVQAALWPALRAWFQARGFEIGEGVPLSANGQLPSTHRAFHSWMTDDMCAECLTQSQIPWLSDVWVDGGAVIATRYASRCAERALVPLAQAIAVEAKSDARSDI